MSGATSILQHTLERPPGLIECQSVLDIGAGVRPMAWYKTACHVCVEPYGPYVDVLRAAGYTVMQLSALESLSLMIASRESIEAIYLLDVIEHMEKDDGAEVLRLATQLASVQVVVFTPNGFKEQTIDAWGYGGDEWQTHRSGWTIEDFPGWDVTIVPERGALFAVWTR